MAEIIRESNPHDLKKYDEKFVSIIMTPHEYMVPVNPALEINFLKKPSTSCVVMTFEP